MKRGNKRNGKRGSTRKPNEDQRNNRRYDDREDSRSNRKFENDISWYSKNPNLLIAAASFPYPWRPGMAMQLGASTVQTLTPSTGDPITNVTVNRYYKIPGIMVFSWMPSLGISKENTDPASVVAKEVYAKVRSAFSGALNADAPDFVMYLMALDSIFSYIAWLKRVYRLMNAWSPDNYVIPDEVLRAMGFSQAAIMALRVDRVKFWQNINELVLQTRKFTCPAIMDIFNRHYWMNDNVYTDAQTINSQFYVFDMKACYQFANLNMPSGDPAGGLQMIALPNRTKGTVVDDFYTFGLNLIQALVDWDEAYEINGYLSRAFAGASMFIVDEIPSDQPFSPVYSEEVLSQIENSRSTSFVSGGGSTWLSDLSGFNVTQDVLSNTVLSSPTFKLSGVGDALGVFNTGVWNFPPVLSVRSDAPTVADSVVASRLQMQVVEITKVSSNNWTVSVDCGSEVLAQTAVWNGKSNFSIEPISLAVTSPGFTGPTTTQFGSWLDLFRLSAFDWHPFTFIVDFDSYSGATSTAEVHVVGDTHNMTTIAKTDMANLHRICLYSEFNSFGV